MTDGSGRPKTYGCLKNTRSAVNINIVFVVPFLYLAEDCSVSEDWSIRIVFPFESS